MPNKRKQSKTLQAPKGNDLLTFVVIEKKLNNELLVWNKITERLERGEHVTIEMSTAMVKSEDRAQDLTLEFMNLYETNQINFTHEELSKLHILISHTLPEARARNCAALKSDTARRVAEVEAKGWTIDKIKEVIKTETAHMKKYHEALQQPTKLKAPFSMSTDHAMTIINDLPEIIEVLTRTVPEEEEQKIKESFLSLTDTVDLIMDIIHKAPVQAYSTKDYQRATLRQRIKAATSRRTNPNWRPLDGGDELFKKEVERCHQERIDQAKAEKKKEKEHAERFR